MEPTHSALGGATHDSLGVLRHRWWLLALTALTGFIGAAGWLQAQDPVWESTTSVLVQPAGQDINVVGGRTQGQVNLDTEAQLVRSTAVAQGAAERLNLVVAPEELTRRVSVEVPPNTSVLRITFAAGTPVDAQAGSRAFAEAYLEHREQAARAELARQAHAVGTRRDELAAILTEINQRLAITLPGTAEAANLESQRATVTGQLNTLSGRLNELNTAIVSAGAIINEPLLPTRPSWPRPPVVLASGVAVGLAAGLGLVVAAERLARRIRRAADLPRRLGIPVLADLTGRATRLPVTGSPVVPPYGAAGRSFDRLRNLVIAQARGRDDEAGGPADQVIVVASPTTESASRLTAVNLAASLARRGHQVVLVEAGGSTSVDSSPRGVVTLGLAEVLAGKATVAQALRRAPYHPGLQVMTMGQVSGTGILQSPVLPKVLAALASQCGYVVVAAPPTGVSADAQSLASHASAVLLVAEARRNRFLELADAVSQCQQVGTPVLGTVLLPPLRRVNWSTTAPSPGAPVSSPPRPSPSPEPVVLDR